MCIRDSRRTPLAEFLGVDEGVCEGATLTASRLDCEAGYIDIEIDEEETGEKIEWLSGLVVTGKRNGPRSAHSVVMTN